MNLPYFISLILTLSLSLSSFIQGVEEEHKIIYLITSPRSLSTAFVRAMHARNDCIIYHEPCVVPHNMANFSGVPEGWFYEDAFKNYEEVKTDLLQSVAYSHVFVKDMAITCRSFLTSERDFIKDPRVHFVFLVRNPHSCLISYLRKAPNFFDLFLPTFGSQRVFEVFSECARQVFLDVAENSANPPLIIFAEELGSDPERVMRGFCTHVDIPFNPDALSWKDLGSEFTGREEWHESKTPALFQYWHGDAVRSTGFSPLRSFELDDRGEPTFTEIENPDHRTILKEAYLFNLPSYRFFKEATNYHVPQ